MYRFLAIFLFVSVFPGRLFAQPSEPILRLHSEMHYGAIRSVSTDGEKYILTASEDKTARLWDMKTGDILRTFRPPIGRGIEGELYACALSSDGSVAIAGGCTGGAWNSDDSILVTKGGWHAYARKVTYSVYFFATTTGEIIRSIDDIEATITDLKLSSDNRLLAIGLDEGKGVLIVNTADGSILRKLKGFGGAVRRIAYNGTGQIAVVADDGYIRLYNSSYGLINAQPLKGKPSDVVFSPDGKEMLVSFGDAARVTVIDAVTLQTKKILNIPFLLQKKSFPSVAYGKDNTLYAGGEQIIYWKNNTTGIIPIGKGKITDLETTNNGLLIYGTSHPEFGCISGDKEPGEWADSNPSQSYRRSSEAVKFDRQHYRHFQLNEDGTRVGITSKNNNVLYFSLNDRELSRTPSSLPVSVDYLPQKGIRITEWRNGQFRLNNRDLQIFEPGETSNSVDISASGSYMVTGTARHIYCLKNDGEILWKQPVMNECIAVKISGDEKVMAAAFSNGTVSWFEMYNGTPLLTLFVRPDNNRWALWTPAGYYDCAAGAEDMIGWHLNGGKNKKAGFYPIAQFRSTFFRPDVVDLALTDPHKAAQLAQTSRGQTPPGKKVITETLPPEVYIFDPRPGSSTGKNRLTISYNVSGKEEKQWVKILIDGRPAQLLPDVKHGYNQTTVEIPERDCEISVIASNRFGAGVPASVQLKWIGNRETDILKPNLYVLAIGISNYKDNSLNLQFAAKDADDFVRNISRQKGLLYKDVQVKLLTDQQATKINILDGLEWLQRETTSRDVAMLFLAGHGVNDNAGTYFFLSADSDPERLRTTSVNYVDIRQTVSAIAGKIIMFVDACHSGNIMGGRRNALNDIDGMVNELASAENGVIVFTSSTGRQYSLENAEWNNGAFTKALVEGIDGKADLFNRKSITIKTLDAYITQRVKELTQGKQAPTTIIPASIPDFPIAVME